MIVADVNLVAYLLINGPFTSAARAALLRDPHWIAPSLWRHEFLNILATSVRQSYLEKDKAIVVWSNAAIFVQDTPIEPPPMEIFRLSVQSRVATYDCTYVVLARRLDLPLITADRKLVEQFPDVAKSLEDFAAGK